MQKQYYKLLSFDLSFNSTGISIFTIEDKDVTKIEFFNVVPFSDYIRKINKNYSTVTIKHYPDIDLDADNLELDSSDKTTYKEIANNIRSLNIMSTIISIIKDSIKINDNPKIIIAIENYIMPQFGGRLSLQNVSGLIAFQSYLRQYMIMFCKQNNIELKLFTPPPKTIKKFFTGNGSADKEQMCNTFVSEFDGVKLIPEMINQHSVKDLNDVIDSFALGALTYTKLCKITYNDSNNVINNDTPNNNI